MNRHLQAVLAEQPQLDRCKICEFADPELIEFVRLAAEGGIKKSVILEYLERQGQRVSHTTLDRHLNRQHPRRGKHPPRAEAAA